MRPRLLHVISGSVDYELDCARCNIETINVKLDNLAYLSKSFFQRVSTLNDCLNYLLPTL